MTRQNGNEHALVMVVDDDITVRTLLAESALGAGFDVLEAVDGNEALRNFRETWPDMILLDVNMPGMSGFEVCTAIRNVPEGTTVPIIIVTGQDDGGSIADAYASGATDFVTKPINWHLLQHRLRYIHRAHCNLDALNRMRTNLSRLERIARVGTWEWNPRTDRIRWSDELVKLMGYGAMPPDAGITRFLLPDETEWVVGTLRDSTEFRHPYAMEHKMIREDGAVRIVHHEGTVSVQADGTPLLTGTIQDITEKRESEEKIKLLSLYDQVTRLPNRLLFKERLGRLIASHPRDKGRHAILVVKERNLRKVHETLGNETGEALFAEMAKRISRCLRNNDTVARIGDHELAILVTGVKQEEDVTAVCERVLDVVEAGIPYDQARSEFFAGIGIGIALFPDDGTQEDALIAHGMAAAVKALGEEEKWKYFKEEMNQATALRLALESDLRRALAQNEFSLYYQPQIEIATGRTVAVEALIRWQCPERGLISPGNFIPIAEETGLIHPLGDWVLRQACIQGASWCREGHRIGIAVNLSAVQFNKRQFLETISETSDEVGFPLEMLELELTESMIMRTPEATIDLLAEVKAKGIRIAVDDFGTGYSSLGYLKKFPIHCLKIDRSFVNELSAKGDGHVIVKAVIELAHALGLTVVAEGVETTEQLSILRTLGCDLFQGFLVSRPVPPDHVSGFFGDWRLDPVR